MSPKDTCPSAPHRASRLTIALAMALFVIAGLGEAADAREPQQTVLPNKNLRAGTAALRAGDYLTAVRLLERGLDAKDISQRHRSASLANLCGALAKLDRPHEAISVCTESLRLELNWPAYHNRALAHLLNGDVTAAYRDIDAGTVLAPHARLLKLARRAAQREEETSPHERARAATMASAPRRKP
ncbi:MAG: hypothetical protein AAFX85_11810 [Pseudomonadota bacterium]